MNRQKLVGERSIKKSKELIMSKKEVNELSSEELAKVNAREEKRVARNEAKARIRSFMKECEDDQLKADLALIVGTGQRAGGGSSKANINNIIRQTFLNKGELTEMEVFKDFRLGRPAMKTKIRLMIILPEPEDRVWVKFFPEEEVYRIVGTGAEPPEDWDGYLPMNSELL